MPDGQHSTDKGAPASHKQGQERAQSELQRKHGCLWGIRTVLWRTLSFASSSIKVDFRDRKRSAFHAASTGREDWPIFILPCLLQGGEEAPPFDSYKLNSTYHSDNL